jgi:L-rhamnose mutarotase
MAFYSWILEVRPGYEEEYKKRHDEIWPDLAKDIRQSGMRNYSIFRYGLTLFGYFECDDLKAAIDYLGNSDANKRWQEWMAPIMKVEVDTNIGFPFLLPLQWHQD